jgi:hypothetical protein
MTALPAIAGAVADDTYGFEVTYIAPPPAPKPAGKVWAKAPVDDKGNRLCPDLHLPVSAAEELAYKLLEAVDEARKADLP